MTVDEIEEGLLVAQQWEGRCAAWGGGGLACRVEADEVTLWLVDGLCLICVDLDEGLQLETDVCSCSCWWCVA